MDTDDEDVELEYDSLCMLQNTLSKSSESEILWKCLQLVSLFSENYEFHKDDMIRLWITQDFPTVASVGEETMEDTVGRYFEEFESRHILRVSQLDYSTRKPRYRLNRSIVNLLQQQQQDDDEYARIGSANANVSDNCLHCSLPESIFSAATLEKLYQAKKLLTLLILHEHHGGHHIFQVPHGFFHKLPFLRVLDFSQTNITELPYSIGKLKNLRYLNLSGTPITRLPDSLCSLSQMQILKLIGCLQLLDLPDGMRKLTNLRHLDVDLACLLVSMPRGIGALTELQSLSAFLVGRDIGCQLTELKHMVNLRGTLRVLRLENVSDSHDAKEAALDEKKYIQKLEFQWSELLDGYEVLQNLKPHTELEDLQMVGYGGANFPTWIGDPVFLRLRTITIHDSRNCVLLPSLGKLPFLHDLCITDMHEVEVIDYWFCGRIDTKKFEAFPRLENLTLNGFPKLQKWSGIEEGDFPCLQKLNISGCSKLTALTQLPLCKSLQRIEISDCPLLESLPDGLPTTLQQLAIVDCPLIKEWHKAGKAEMLVHIPSVSIDYQQIFPQASGMSDFDVGGCSKDMDTDDEDVELEYDSLCMLQNTLSKSSESEILWKCLQLVSLFSENYEFHKDDMIRLWMTQDFPTVASVGEETMEDTVGRYFEEFESRHILRVSQLDYSTRKPRYRLNRSIVNLLQQQQQDDDEYARIGSANANVSDNCLHCSLPESIFSAATLEKLYQAKKLLTLLILHEHHGAHHIFQVPRGLFHKLPFLRVLDFSHTNITELPYSIGKLKNLRYLNLSGTPITRLPDSLCSLSKMQILKLIGCLKLLDLPDGMRKLTNLRHLDVDLACLLVSMPRGIGALTELQSLPAFLVGRDIGCQLTELKHMVNLRGTLRVLRLENVSGSDEAKKAALDEKKYIQKLEFQWSELLDGYEVLQNLKPHTELRELQMVGYGGASFPIWIGDPSFLKLRTITIHDSRNCVLIPSLGKLPLLYDLCITEMHEVEVIDYQFCGRSMDPSGLDAKKFEAFPSLENLTLNGFPKLQKWSGIEEGDFPRLQKLNISGCSKLTALTQLPLCKSLQRIEISDCPLLDSLPDGLPTTLQQLAIVDCPLIKEWHKAGKAEMLVHIPSVSIDYQQIFPQETASNETKNKVINSASTSTSVPPPMRLKDVETSSDDDAESEGATTRRPVKEIVELRLQQLYDSMANQSCNKFSSFHAEFDEMMKKLDVMRSFLNQISTDEEDPMVERISAQIREFVYEADDIVLDCQIRADYEELFPLPHDVDIPGGMGFPLRIERMLRDLIKHAEGIEMRINDLNEYGDPKNQMSLTRNKGYIGSTSARRVSYNGRSHSKAIGLIEDILKEDVRKIKGWIFTNEKSPQIAITGKGGLGKSTIARTIYKDDDVRCYFYQLIWVTVSTPFSKTDILRSFLIQLGLGDRVNSHDDDVMSRIKRSLYNKRYLIVMEDVQDMDYDWWRMLLEHLPAERDRSIIITTTNEEIARNMGVTYFHRARNLDENESWSLFCEVAFSADQKRNLNSEFETVGKDIVKKCKGILLAIKAVAGLLATKTESSVQWEVVNNNFQDGLNAILQLSYDDLPAMLKHCILCFSIYPQGTLIDAEQLIYWWVGEGFVQGDDRKTAIEVAFQCLSQLVSRCLVEVEVDHNNRGYDRMMYRWFDNYRGYDRIMYRGFDHYRGYDGRIYKCRMHKSVRDFIIGKSRIEGFSSSDDKGCRHLGYTSKMDKEILGNNPKLRAFLSMEDVSPSKWDDDGPYTMHKVVSALKLYIGPDRNKSMEEAILKLDTGPDRIKSLRVLDLSLGRLRVDVGDLLSFIESQKRLAYLNLKGVANLTQLPDWIKEHRNLKILVLNKCNCLEKLPSSITTLHNLLVLDVTDCYGLTLPPGFGGLTKLQVLRGFRVSREHLAELRELKNLAELRELTIILYMIDEIDREIFDEIGDGEEYFLSPLSKLKVLTIHNVGGTIVNRLKPPPSLKELTLEHLAITPHWLTPASLPNLVYLNIDGGLVEGVNPSFWEGNGEGWRIEGLCFNNLFRFKLDWEVVKSKMKYLRYAEVRYCPGLKSFPLGANNYGVWEKEEESE